MIVGVSVKRETKPSHDLVLRQRLRKHLPLETPEDGWPDGDAAGTTRYCVNQNGKLFARLFRPTF